MSSGLMLMRVTVWLHVAETFTSPLPAFGLRQLCLRFFHVFLHFLRLLHQAAKSCFAEHIGILLWVWFAAA